MAELDDLKKELLELEIAMTKPEVLSNANKLTELSKQYGQLKEKYIKLERQNNLDRQIQDLKAMIQNESDEAMINLAQKELNELSRKKAELQKGGEAEANWNNTIVEIRAGTGGEEAALFAADLYRMYAHFAERQHWATELLSTNTTSIGGYKEVVFKINGKNSYPTLSPESGVHRVQRIPNTEKNGRVHTSTASVAILPEATEVDIKIRPEDLDIDTYRSSGKGGQNVQKVETAVRITHRPTGLVVTSQEERSQSENKEKALKILRTRLLAQEEEKRLGALTQQRRSQIGQAKRVEKIRTYNFPQNRITDHRINKSWFNINEIMDGKLDEVVKDLQVGLAP
ncbi:MAG: peptide chain release factor 1 [Candidatus Parcubacteria bacterium]|nr:peptide chain release factor 1 [Candidatus Parcubacteria bacterium]